MKKINKVIELHNVAIDSLYSCEDSIYLAAGHLISCMLEKKGTIFWAGNGGSAADAQHYAAELMVRYSSERIPIKSIALTTDTSLLTAHSNDYEYKTVFERQVQGLVSSKDIFVGISTSGNSENILLAVRKAKEIGATTIGMLGNDGGKIGQEVDIPIIVASNITAHIQEAHLVIGHFLCDSLEGALIESNE